MHRHEFLTRRWEPRLQVGGQEPAGVSMFRRPGLFAGVFALIAAGAVTALLLTEPAGEPIPGMGGEELSPLPQLVELSPQVSAEVKIEAVLDEYSRPETDAVAREGLISNQTTADSRGQNSEMLQVLSTTDPADGVSALVGPGENARLELGVRSGVSGLGVSRGPQTTGAKPVAGVRASGAPDAGIGLAGQLGSGKGRAGYSAQKIRSQAESAPVLSGAILAGDEYLYIAENGFRAVADTPLSTLSVDVDTASYSNVRRYLTEGQLPPRDAVRIEEMLNYFPYGYAPPTDGAPFAASAEVTAAPWSEGHRLVRLGLKGREISGRNTPARNLVFLVDVSGSMPGPDRLTLVKQGLAMLVKQLGARDHVAMVVYAGSAGTVLQPTPGDHSQAITEAIHRLEAGGSTAGGEGIRAAYALAREHFDKRAINRVILATDGDFNVGTSSDAEMVQLIEKQRSSGVFLTVLGFGRGNLQDAKMEQLADKGNGNYAYIDGYGELQKVLGEEIGSTLVTIAKDVKIQVEWNPALVGAWRLIGYENRVLADRDFADDGMDAGEIGAGHAITALYEVVPAASGVVPEVGPLKYQAGRDSTLAAASGELFTVRLRYKEPEGELSKLLSFPVRDVGNSFANASIDTRWAAAVAGFGMLLRDSPHMGELDWGWVSDTGREALGRDKGGYRAEMLSLVEKARSIRPPSPG